MNDKKKYVFNEIHDIFKSVIFTKEEQAVYYPFLQKKFNKISTILKNDSNYIIKNHFFILFDKIINSFQLQKGGLQLLLNNENSNNLFSYDDTYDKYNKLIFISDYFHQLSSIQKTTKILFEKDIDKEFIFYLTFIIKKHNKNNISKKITKYINAQWNTYLYSYKIGSIINMNRLISNFEKIKNPTLLLYFSLLSNLFLILSNNNKKIIYCIIILLGSITFEYELKKCKNDQNHLIFSYFLFYLKMIT